MKKIWITLKDSDGSLRPMAYLESKERHDISTPPKLEDGESYVEVTINEND